MKETMQRVICAHCGWAGRRKTGNIVFCPRCDNAVTFDIRDDKAKEGK